MDRRKELTVGLSISLTGAYSLQGQQAFSGIRLWQSYTNAEGGVRVNRNRRTVRLICYDDRSRVEQTRQNLARLLTEDRIDVLLGPYSSGLTMVAAGLTQEHGKVLWNHGGSSDEIFLRGCRYVVSTPSPASNYFWPLPTWLIRTYPSLQRVCLVYSGKGTFAAHVARGFVEAAEAAGHHLVQSVRLNSTNLGHAIQQIGTLKPEVLVLAANFADELRILRAHQISSDSVRVVAAVAAGVQAFQQELKQAAEGVIGPSQWEPAFNPTRVRGPDSPWFVQSFQKQYGRIPDYTAAGAFAMGLILTDCIERADTLDTQSLYEAATKLDLTTFYGPFRIEPASGRQIGHRILLTRWQRGRKVVLLTDI